MKFPSHKVLGLNQGVCIAYSAGLLLEDYHVGGHSVEHNIVVRCSNIRVNLKGRGGDFV